MKKTRNYETWKKAGMVVTMIGIDFASILVVLLVLLIANRKWDIFKKEFFEIEEVLLIISVSIAVPSLVIGGVFWGLGNKHIKTSHKA